MSRRRSRRRDYNAPLEDRHGGLFRASESIHRDSSAWDEADRVVLAAPPLAPIRRHVGLEPDELMSSPASISLPEAASWVEHPPVRSTFAQGARTRHVRSSPSYSLASLLRPFYRVPEAVKACIRRKERREVIFAKIGGGRGTPPRDRTEESNYRC